MLNKFLKNTDGNFSAMFAVGVTVLVIGAGVAIDSLGITSQKQSLQNMADAAVISAISTGEDDIKVLNKIVEQSLAVNNKQGLVLDFDLVAENRNLTLNVNSPYNTKLLGFIGKDKLNVNALSQVGIPEDVPINVAMVLDRTDSMQGENISALRAASSVLIDQFADYSAETQVAVVPFSEYVNVGTSRRNERWLDVPADITTTTPAFCEIRDDRPCIQRQRTNVTRTVDGVNRTRSVNRCVARANNGPKEFCEAEKTETQTWNGCIGSRNGNLNEQAAFNNRRIPGILGETCGEEILPLTRDLDAVKARINSLSTGGFTYIPVGLINGWRMLNPNLPFDSFSNVDEGRRRTLILMTDGKNTRSISDPYNGGRHDDEDEDAANDLTATICANVKDDNIDIWSVAYRFEGESSTDTKAVLRTCASTPSQFFDAENRAELIAAFEDIGRRLFAVRLTK